MPSHLKRSRLVPWGAVLLAAGLVVPRSLTVFAAELQGWARGIAFLMTDVFRICFFAGVACLIIGGLRNRRWSRQARAADSAGAQGPGATGTP